MKVRTLSIIVAAIAALTLTTGCVGSRGSDATSDTTPTSTTIKPKVTEGSFAELRKTCNDEDRKIFNKLVHGLSKYPKVADTPETAPYPDELRFMLGGIDPDLTKTVREAAEDSCLKAFEPYLPPVQPTTRGSGNGGGSGGGSGGTPTQPTVGGSNCSGGNIDPDGTGPRGCEPTVPSDVGAGGGTPTQPVPPPATTLAVTVPVITIPATEPTTPTTQPVVVIDENGQPTGVTAPPVTEPPATPVTGECWIIDDIPQGNCN